MSIVIVCFCIALLILLIALFKIHPFPSFIFISILAALLLKIPLPEIPKIIGKGIGNLFGDLAVIICLGAMMGKLIAESGAAQKISDVLMNLFGKKYFQWAMMITGFIVGIPLFYNVGFVLLIPLIFSVVYTTKLPAVYVGIPMLAALSVTHGFLPPHPAPTALVSQFDANLGLTLFYGIIIAIPAIILAGPVFASTLKRIPSKPLETFQPALLESQQLPSAFNSFFSALLPVILLISFTVVSFFSSGNQVIAFLSDPNVIMLVALIWISFSLGIFRKIGMNVLSNYYTSALKDVAMILLVIAGAGALKQVLQESGVSNEIGLAFQHLNIDPLILGWLMAAVIRVCVGSATVAGLTAAGIIAPFLLQTDANPNLMVLSIGAGSLMFSHVNDSGFWMFKEYFNLSIIDTIRSWSVMESIVSVTGLLGVLLLKHFV